ncbi:MAG: pyridoxamine 5'-phosphate oxidase family protein [Lachnospiraceae bacterium]|nr:pyridoxamine 5'-phosphate oxidase family protein [Lachnospiraceae bacterium]MBD5483280.1 pyridoxamine 5'-phosphate oxidase family protein [Lachnospiraceae bacterium]
MEKLNQETKKIMEERFGKDNIIALATLDGEMPSVRNVDGFYEDGAFYTITYALSDKMKQIEKNPNAAIAGEWFTAHGKAVSLGYFGRAENEDIAGKLRTAFAEWIDNGHNNFEDENTVILCVRLTDGVLFSQGKRYEIDFTADGGGKRKP